MTHPSPNPRRRGFTLVELLVVISILVIIVAIAVPTLNALSGGRSVEAAQNQVSSVLGLARLEAIGIQEPRGVLFYRDAASDRVGMVLIRQTFPPISFFARPIDSDAYYFDIDPSRDPLLLPRGVGLQVLDEVTSNSDDRYVGYNDADKTVLPTGRLYGGVILFDGMGRLMNVQYRLMLQEQPFGSATYQLSGLGRFLYNTEDATSTGSKSIAVPANPLGSAAGPINWPQSSVGFVLYDEPTFRANPNYGDADFQYDSSKASAQNELRTTARGAAPSSPQPEEEWLDDNAAGFLVNRYNGTLIRAQ